MNRGIYVASSSPQLPALYDGRRRFRDSSAQDDRIERVLRRSRSIDKVRSLDADCPALFARATRLSTLYGASLDSELARKGAGQRPGRRRRRRNPRSSSERQSGGGGGGNGTPSSSAGGERERGTSTMSQMTRKQKRTLRRALNTASEVALRYTMEASVGMKAFDGPPLGPKDVKDLLLRNFRIRLPMSEAAALITHFVKVHDADSIEHGDFLHAIQRLRRELLVKRKGGRSDKSKTSNRRRPLPPISIVGDGASSAPVYSSSSAPRTIPAGNCSANPTSMGDTVGALAKVDRAASSFDRRRFESLRQADLSGATSPRAFGYVLLTRFGVNADPLEQRELVALLRDENGAVDVERFRAYFLGLIGDDLGATKSITTTAGGGSATNERDNPNGHAGAALLPLHAVDDTLRRLKAEAQGRGEEDGREGEETRPWRQASAYKRIGRSHNPNQQCCDVNGVRYDSGDDSCCRGGNLLMRAGMTSTRPTAAAAEKAPPIEHSRAPPWGVGGSRGGRAHGSIR